MLIREILGDKIQTQRANNLISENGNSSHWYRGAGHITAWHLPNGKCDMVTSEASRCQCGWALNRLTQPNLDKSVNRIMCLNHDYQPIFSDDSGIRQYYRCTKCDSVNT